MTDDERDELGKIVRAALQKVGISSREPWEAIGEHRRERHRDAAEDIWAGFNLYLQTLVGRWGNETFPQSTAETIMAHLKDEIEELHWELAEDEDSEAITEAADCQLLLLHLAHKKGFVLIDASLRKHKVNTDRTWMGEMNDRGYFGHVEEPPDGQ